MIFLNANLSFIYQVINQLPVETVPRIENQVLDDPTFCEVCHQSDREDRMLLCDNCDCGYHMECLTPPMTTVPIEEWYCPGCTRNNSTRTVTVLIIKEYLKTNYMLCNKLFIQLN